MNATHLCDLHIHSKYARATSTECAPAPLELWARRKGLALIGTGDCTHALWRNELAEALVLGEEGLYRLKPEARLPLEGPAGSDAPRFVVSGEISTIYKKNGKTRKVHHVILLPTLEDAARFSARLEGHGANLHSDGRPILGLDSRDLLEMLLDACPQAMLIPAHIWTPHFSLFGAFSGFDSLSECFEDLTPHIHALETGLSSDPPMNWRLSALDSYLLVSNSDAHSPAKLGREATILRGELSWETLRAALSGGAPAAFGGTVEFYPEEGKYHFDGHRPCGVCLSPAEASLAQGRCPACGKRLTLGVSHRVSQLADRPEGFLRPDAPPFERLVPLHEIAAAALGVSPNSKKAQELYHELIGKWGSEFFILRKLPLEEAGRALGPCFQEALARVREGRLHIAPGYDGEFGKVAVFAPGERDALAGQISFLGGVRSEPARIYAPSAPGIDGPAPRAPRAKAAPSQGAQTPNEGQRAAAQSDAPATAVVAGPGTGKTQTLTARVLYLIKERKVSPEAIACVTFTQKAAQEMRQRLAELLPKAAKKLWVGTFHSLCLRLLSGRVTLLSPEEQALIAQELIAEMGWSLTAPKLLQLLSRLHSTGRSPQELPENADALYTRRLNALEATDFDGLLAGALRLAEEAAPPFAHLLVDEFQDVSPLQYRLTLAWARRCESLFVIGDPDQAIYGFRGADSACFDRLKADLPQLAAFTLTENYRSSPQIIACAKAAILPNGGGARPLAPHCPEGPPVADWLAASDFAEGIAIAKAINALVGGMDMLKASTQQESRGFAEIAVLYRTHRQAEILEKCLTTEGIPYRVSGRSERLMDPAVQGAVCFLRFLYNPKDQAALRLALMAGMGLTAPASAAVVETWQAHESLAACPAFESLAAALRPLIRREKPARLLASYLQMRKPAPSPALEELTRTALCYPDTAAFLDALTLGEEGDLTRAGGKAYKADAVTLSTLHGAKGLEFPVVFLAGVKTGILPMERPGLYTDPAEERRLFYVGITRAKAALYLCHGGAPSPFLAPLTGLSAQRVGPAKPAARKQLSFF